jgi:hypothetical protein
MRLPLEPPVQDLVEDLDEPVDSLQLISNEEAETVEGRVPSWRLKALIDRIQSLLCLSERQVIHRFLATQVGISTRSVLRYDKGDVETSPSILIEAARDILERIRMGKPIVFLRGRDVRPVVVRKQFVDLVDRVIRSELFIDRFDLFKQVEDELGLQKGRVARLYRSSDVQLIDSTIYECISGLVQRARYDPRACYKVGDRVRHPVFGVGTVQEKVPREKIRVRFGDGSERVLREQLEEDPIRRRLHGSYEASDHHVLALNRY